MATKTSSNSRGNTAQPANETPPSSARGGGVHTIILFAVGILVAALTWVKGSSGWNWLRHVRPLGWGAIFVAR